jgi:cell division protein FtsN
LDGNANSTPSSGASTPGSRGGEEKRPEKSTAVASRLIAAGIGQKAPKRTKEQREYDQAMKVQEKKKRDQAREEEERKRREKEKALKDVWGD